MLSQAVVEFGAPLQAIETPTPMPQGTEVLLRVTTLRRLPHRRPHP